MMISYESYYEEYLNGRTKEQIRTVMRGLKQEIGRLKIRWKARTMAKPPVMHSSEYARLLWTREYL